jgi:hypothetical protein
MYIHHITKLEFLPAFRAAFLKAFKSENIQAGFRATGLTPLDPETVLLKLDVKLDSPIPPPPANQASWISKIPTTLLKWSFNLIYFEIGSNAIKTAHHLLSSSP